MAVRDRTGHEGEQRVPQGVGGDQPTSPGQGDVELTLEQGQQRRDEEGAGCVVFLGLGEFFFP